MRKTSFNTDWGVRHQTSPFLEILGQAEAPQPVTLPHDWLISQPRSAENKPGALTGYHGEDVVEYVKTFTAPDGFETGRVEVQFDGVYRGAMMYVNDAFVAQRPYGYIPFSVRIDPYLHDGENQIRVECRNHLDARWYSGLGIYRDTWLLTGGATHIARNGVRVRTRDADAWKAVIDVTTTVENDSQRLDTVTVITEVVAPTGEIVAAESARLSVRPGEAAPFRQRFALTKPSLWSPQTPSLHTVRTRLIPTSGVEEVHEEQFGIRTLNWDAQDGLLINGQPVKLRGGCIHHDNGVLGAATIAQAEERRVQLLKDAGYNAIRSAHNPISTVLLEACDRIGMLVLDEFTDGWTTPTLGFGYGLDLNEWWQRDLTELIERDYNHPSVIMYSIGNEVADTGNSWGATFGRDLVDWIKSLDDTRPVTNSINPMMTVLHDLKAELGKDDSAGVNAFMRDLGEQTHDLVVSDLATERLEEPMSQLDISGYNYAYGRYELDIERHPQRLLLGTEGLPGKLDEVWPYVVRYPQVIGEFSWTAWEYVGEAGLGADKPAEEAFFGNYPWRFSGTGDLGITGQRRTISYWRETVWGLRSAPFIAVHRPDAGDRDQLRPSIYTWSDSVNSWSFPGREGATLTVDVYSDADEVELLLNGNTIGRSPAGAEHRFIASFQLPYQPGELTAVAHRGGAESGRSAIRTAGGDVTLTLSTERKEIIADDRDLAFIEIAFTDGQGTVHISRGDEVTVTVSGSGALQGLGSDNPASEDDYTGASCHAYRGRALAVIRPTSAGPITIRVEAGDLSSEVTVTAVEA
ncbi:glycoside hydrolase family 2 TIM barrel-domain containing protein [Leifsonia sp. 1010]|uniref:glycoside hydrolase family 2 TIM barrel-domain containing protein n=1 Tax=Leifsonia sp. 1010 TaxID=2817769 RepID=UPI0028668B62|nr:glycoside hydrolase family 2 TIM barrel-domain containing protein [Leifsonia sp. 1010]MDR6610721.1 hypothetical protein [Leifsonia sp. 1010]